MNFIFRCDGRETCDISPAVATYMRKTDHARECIPNFELDAVYQYELDTGLYSYSCRTDRVLHNMTESCYQINDIGNATFTESRTRCQELGGDLPFFSSNSGLYDWIYENFPSDFESNGQTWSMGTSDFDRDFTPYTESHLVTPAILTSEGAFPCMAEECDLTLNSVCVFPKEMLSDSTETQALSCNSTEADSCQDCYVVGLGIGEMSRLDDINGTMCKCEEGFYGQNCEHEGKNNRCLPKCNTLIS